MTSIDPLQPGAEQNQQRHINQVELVGYLAPQRRGDSMVLARAGRTATGGSVQRLLLQVIEPEDGSTYAVPIRAPSPLLAELPLAERSRVHVSGGLAWRQSYDPRYATTRHPEGRATRELALEVTAIRLAHDSDIDGSWAKLRGVVVEPPSVRPHERETAMIVVRGMLQVQMQVTAARSGSRCTHIHIERIPVDVPLALDGACAALKQGNQIELEGRLEPFQRTLRDDSPDVRQVLAAHEAAWADQLEKANGQALIAARRRIGRERARLLQTTQFRVRAGYIELLSGELITPDAARAARQRWLEQRRATRRSPEAPATPTDGPNRGSATTEAWTEEDGRLPDLDGAGYEAPGHEA